MAAIEVSSLTVRYGDVVAVDDLSFTADAGRVTCVLGRNGAGKTSTIECLEGLRRPAAGRLSVVGLDPLADHRALVPRIGVMLQEGGVQTAVRPLEILRHAAALYTQPMVADEVAERLGLTELAGRTWRQLSGGEQRRLALGLALMGRPQVAFLDEPTAGVDPSGRQTIREVIRDLRASGVAVLLTTHDLDEAERVADDIVILDRSRLVAWASLAELVGRGGSGHRVRFSTVPGLDVASLAGYVRAPVVEASPGRYEVGAPPNPAVVAAITAWLAAHDLRLDDLHAGRQRLEDVFLHLTSATGPQAAARPAVQPGRTFGPARSGDDLPPALPEGRGPGGVQGAGDSLLDRRRAVRAAAAFGGRPDLGGQPAGPGPAVPPSPHQPAARRRPGPRSPRGSRGPVLAPLVAHVRLDLALTLRNGESLLLTLGFPVILLVFFSLVDVLPTDGDATDFLVPGMLSLAVLATAFANLAIATGFDRSYGVLKRLGATPLGRGRLLAAKIVTVLAVLTIQTVVVVVAGLALGWRPDVEALPLAAAVVLAVVSFVGLALVVAGTLRALVALAAANAIFVGALLLSGMVFPLDELPGGLRTVVRGLPSTALAEAVRGSLTASTPVPVRVWPVLGVWAVVAVTLAVRLFRWEPSD